MTKIDYNSFQRNRVISSVNELFNLTRLKIFFFAYCKHQTEWNHPHERQGAHTLYLVLGGDGFLNSNGKITQMEAGKAYLLPKDKEIGLSCITGVEKLWGHFSLNLYSGYDLLKGIDDVVELGNFNLERSIDEMVTFPEQNSFTGDFYIKSLILLMLSRLDSYWNSLVHSVLPSLHQYSKVLNYINGNLSAQLRSNELADMMSMTPQSLSRAFKRDMGTTLKRFISGLLNERACSLIGGTDMLIKDIANELGYDDEYHFSRNFSKALGKSPSRYRSTVRGIRKD